MTATATFRATGRRGLIPAQGTYAVAANVLLLGGTIVTADADGRADVVTAGQNALGILKATSDNRTTAPEGGAAAAVDAEVEFGVFGLAYTGTAPEPGQVVYVVDNQTVSTDSDTGSRGIAGYCVDLSGGQCWTWMGPHVTAQIVIAATEASQLDTAQADIVDLQTDVSLGRIQIPVESARVAAGTAVAAWADGSANGIAVDESVMYRWNVAGSPALAAIWYSVALPPELDGTENVEIHAMCSRTGSADTTVVLTCTAFFQVAAAAYDADADCGGNSTPAVAGATKVITETIVTIAAANVPDAGPAVLSFSLIPTAALDADDLNLHGLWIEFAKTPTAS
ncbi:MAG: hypothetical protein A2Y78_00240 [Acidobacteria bacterium RBG_13_68_16]|nr:MAG: hypothetical protein A2Y78_00240 [Acidobacteria bacterium RBG_13_68_16]